MLGLSDIEQPPQATGSLFEHLHGSVRAADE
jgi:hypothetical protein